MNHPHRLDDAGTARVVRVMPADSTADVLVSEHPTYAEALTEARRLGRKYARYFRVDYRFESCGCWTPLGSDRKVVGA